MFLACPSSVAYVPATWFGEQDCEVEIPEPWLLEPLELTVFTVLLPSAPAQCSSASGDCWATYTSTSSSSKATAQPSLPVCACLVVMSSGLLRASAVPLS